MTCQLNVVRRSYSAQETFEHIRLSHLSTDIYIFKTKILIRTLVRIQTGRQTTLHDLGKTLRLKSSSGPLHIQNKYEGLQY